MCTEFWIGWYDAWGDKEHHTTDTAAVTGELDTILSLGHVNIYMFHGGTNFGFMNGANDYDRLTPDVTSYDYDAPLSEDGSITEKYRAFQKIIARHTHLQETAIVSQAHKNYGSISTDGFVRLFDCLDKLSTPVVRDEPCFMEKLGQAYGYILYSCHLAEPIDYLEFELARDRVQVFSNRTFIRSLSDREIPGKHAFTLPSNSELQLLVENMGRVNYGTKLTEQRKGLGGPVFADDKPLKTWECRSIPLADLSELKFSEAVDHSCCTEPAFYHFTLNIEEIGDTFLELPGWGKGCVFINNFNLGRFWNIGPQKRLYLPAPLLHKGRNDIVVFETEGIIGKEIRFS